MVEKLDNGKYKITHLGRSIETKFFKEISDAEYFDIFTEFYSLPFQDELCTALRDIKDGKYNLSIINQNYFRQLMSECGGIKCKWTVQELIQSKELVEVLLGKTDGNPFYDADKTLFKKFMSSMRMGGKDIAVMPGSFPLKTVDSVLQKYNLNNNYYDFSCGWGVRLLGSLRNNVNYFGTDPNYKLTEKLAELVEDYKKANNTDHIESLWDEEEHFPSVDIRTQGSEDFVPEWENKMGLAFTSTPYFNIEDYKYGKQSWKKGCTVDEWLESYMFPTFDNIYKYLIENGHCLLNIKEPKDFPNIKFIDKIIKYAESIGFTYLGEDTVKLGIRNGGITNGNGTTLSCSSDEGMYVFKKGKPIEDTEFIKNTKNDFIEELW